MKKALVTGITGQDGSYLAELLLEKGYEVHGIKRRSSSLNTTRIDHLYQDPHESDRRLFLHYGDLSDATGIIRLIKEIRPEEIYNLGAMSHVRVSFDNPEYTAEIDAMGTLRLLEAIRICDLTNKCRFYQASTSELFGKAQQVPQTERTPFYPRSPYAVAKLYAHWITVNYREAYNMYACNGILFNHESPVRGETFVSRKITMAVARIVNGFQDVLFLGNLDAQRDWGHAKDYVEAMWLMLQQDRAEDYVIATGITTSVRQLVELAFGIVGVEIGWQGTGLDEVGIVTASNPEGKIVPLGKEIIRIDPNYHRPTEVDLLVGDSSKAQEELGWQPKFNLHELIGEMVNYDLAVIQQESGEHAFIPQW